MKTAKLKTLMILFVCGALIWTACKKDEEIVNPSNPDPNNPTNPDNPNNPGENNNDNVPSITEFLPTSGEIGTEITITGTNFKDDAEQITVKIGEDVAEITSSTITEIKVKVGDGMETGKISVTIGEDTAISEGNFEVTEAAVVENLSITSFEPTSGVVGSQVIIAGSDFSTTPGNNIVKIGDELVEVLQATSTELTISLTGNAVSGKFTVEVSDKSVTSENSFELKSPTISGFTPSYGLPGDEIVISGSNFSPSDQFNTVKINGVEAVIQSFDESSITAIVPENATTGKVKMVVGVQYALSQEDFEVLIDIPRDGLVAFFPFSGNTNDVSDNQLTGNSVGPILAEDRFGSADHAYSFDGANDYMNMGNPTELQLSNTLTTSVWVNISAFKANQTQTILTKIFFDPNDGFNPKLGYTFNQRFMGDGTPSWSSATYSTLTLTSSGFVGGNVAEDQWANLTFVIDNKDWKFYENGILIDSGSYGSALVDDGTLGDLTIGAYGAGFIFQGRIDDLVIYDKALNANEVQQLFDQTVTKY